MLGKRLDILLLHAGSTSTDVPPTRTLTGKSISSHYRRVEGVLPEVISKSYLCGNWLGAQSPREETLRGSRSDGVVSRSISQIDSTKHGSLAKSRPLLLWNGRLHQETWAMTVRLAYNGPPLNLYRSCLDTRRPLEKFVFTHSDAHVRGFVAGALLSCSLLQHKCVRHPQ